MPDATTTDAPGADPLDAELRRIAHALVAEAPAAPPRPFAGDGGPLVARPGPSRRRGRRLPLAAAAAAVAIVALGAGALVVARGGDGDDPASTVLAADAGLEAAPQRLIFDDGRHELPPGSDEPVRLELAGLDARTAPRPLPGGGHVVVGVHPVPYPPPEGFNEFTDTTFGLAVVGPDGEVEVSRDLAEESTLVGATATEAILARQPEDDRGEATGPVDIVAHDLATGEERVVRHGVTFEPDNDMATARWAIVGDRLVTVEASYRTEPMEDEAGAIIVPGSEQCTLRVTDLTTGDETERPVDLACSQVMGVQAAPDGSHLAVTYEGPFSSESFEVRLAVVDLRDGAVTHDQLLGHAIDCRGGPCPPDVRPITYRGMAWDDASTLRLAINEGSGAGRLVVERVPVG